MVEQYYDVPWINKYNMMNWLKLALDRVCRKFLWCRVQTFIPEGVEIIIYINEIKVNKMTPTKKKPFKNNVTTA